MVLLCRRVSRRRERDRPAPGILARGSSRPSQPSHPASRCFAPLRRDSGSRPYRLGDGAPRLQWRHRVGFAPTSLGRRAQSVQRLSIARRARSDSQRTEQTNGPTVQRSNGPTIQRTNEPTNQGKPVILGGRDTPGQLVEPVFTRQVRAASVGPLDRWIVGSLDRWIVGPFVPSPGGPAVQCRDQESSGIQP
jgi:hypothetical protein